MAKIKSSAEEQLKAEKRRFALRMRPKPVLCERIARREEKLREQSGHSKQYMEDLL
jgi:hypothetical protein